MANDVLVIVEQREGELKKVNFEVVGKARALATKLGGRAAAVVLGEAVREMAGPLAQHGAGKVYVGDDPALGVYSPDGWATVIVDLVKRTQPAVILGPATAFGRDLMPRLAAKLDAGMASDVTGLELENGRLAIERPIYADAAIAVTRLTTDPQIATLRPNTFPAPEPDPNATAEVEALQVADYTASVMAKEIIAAGGEGLDVTEADIVVSGGRGVGSAENFEVLENLAKVLPNAAIGSSRAAVDAGWRPHNEQIGQTGKTISPNLYVACGISGAVQHVSGMKASKYIVAVNKDPDAPIFKLADYGIVGDLFKVVPKITEEVKKLQEE